MDVGRCSCLLWGRLEVGDFLRLFLTQTALFCDLKFCYLELIARWVVPKPQSRTQNILFCCSCTVSLRKACMPSAYDMAILSYKEENNYVWLLLGWWKLEKKKIKSEELLFSNWKPRCLIGCQRLLKYVIHSICCLWCMGTVHWCQLMCLKQRKALAIILFALLLVRVQVSHNFAYIFRPCVLVFLAGQA